MDFEYNGNLLEDERIEIVAREIIKCYPFIKIEKAKEAAMLEGRLSNDVTTNEKLERLYNIMLVNEDNKDIVFLIFKDFNELITSNPNETSKYYLLIEEINNYFNKSSKFPILSDY